MVDALRRASRWLTPGGCVIDIHPTATPAAIEIGGAPAGRVDTSDAPARHAAADAALTQAVQDGLLVVAVSDLFDFYTHADTLEELREHIEENWRDARVVVETPRVGRPRAHERVRITKLFLAGGRTDGARTRSW